MLQAITADPTQGLPHVACCISMGRMALFSDNKGKVALAKAAREHAVVALEKEPQSDLAHHLMGRYLRPIPPHPSRFGRAHACLCVLVSTSCAAKHITCYRLALLKASVLCSGGTGRWHS